MAFSEGRFLHELQDKLLPVGGVLALIFAGRRLQGYSVRAPPA
jgi:hypothetical protein